MAHHTQDEGFHEIQLNGKQLVFLFMAATVVSVVIFLCGVLVGRGVRAQIGVAADVAQTAAAPETTPIQPATPAPASAPAAGSDPTIAPPPPTPKEDLSYYDRLDKPTKGSEQLKPAPDRPLPAERAAAAVPSPAPRPPASAPAKEPAHAPAPAPASPPVSAASTSPASTVPAPAPAAEPAGQGFAVQVAALNVRSEADAIAKRLSGKGYAAYVLSPASGTPSVFRVRVGKFNTRREAESVAAKLQKEEQFKPWVTR